MGDRRQGRASALEVLLGRGRACRGSRRRQRDSRRVAERTRATVIDTGPLLSVLGRHAACLDRPWWRPRAASAIDFREGLPTATGPARRTVRRLTMVSRVPARSLDELVEAG